jgi:hypothetical protein
VDALGFGLGAGDCALCYYTSDNADKNLIESSAYTSVSENFGLYQASTTLRFHHFHTSTPITYAGISQGLVMGNSKSGTNELVRRASGGITVHTSNSDAVFGTAPSINQYFFARNNVGAADSYTTRPLSFVGIGLGHTTAERTTFLNEVYSMFNGFTTHKPTMV